MDTQPHRFGFASMGTQWQITIWDPLDAETLKGIHTMILQQSTVFDHTYSRFIASSLVCSLSKHCGVAEVPTDLVTMIRLYETLHDLSGGTCNPLIGFTLEDLGYDRQYSFIEQPQIRQAPPMHAALRIIDDERIELLQPALLDIGAVGKGFFVDKIAIFLKEKSIRRFLVDGSGDIFYRGDGQAINAGLEHPDDPAKVIGSLEMTHGALCASGSNRRKWGTHHHIVDPSSGASPKEVTATWVTAETAMLADGLATCLFLASPECFLDTFHFDYCILNHEQRVKHSQGFHATFF